ncbi:MAG: 16S rRNA (adenine(1518)-N(6)/adenine(1519)-N(6))-dimethyltransferase RsmA, partial [Candidatus Izemoplasmatales bacterium]|nr:16S rRNA (adenine(1518)-N(6)/adenine(1519)-N(6))-dimethyltransferase RsmA [Candidatus Izemoplasmatales bacterium]
MKKIGTINEIKDSIHRNEFRIKKYFGQNFLVDQNILEQIVLKAGITKATNVIEIGPGLGSLTQKLLDASKHVLAYEIDKDLIPILNKEFSQYKNFTLIQNDILKVNIDEEIDRVFSDQSDIIVVSNLPYYITTPILMKFLETSKKVKKMVFMVQYEVAKRITSKPNTKDYNALSIVIQYRASASILFNVPKNVFIPEPSVDSAVIAVEVKNEIAHLADNEEFFF